jgi:hypothetical protein
MLDAGDPNAHTFGVDAIPYQHAPQRKDHQNFYIQTSYVPKIAGVSGGAVNRSNPTTITSGATDRQVPIAVSRRDTEKESCSCSCSSVLLSQNSPKSQVITPLWSFTPDWAPEWSEAEIEKEEGRRLVWASLILVAGHTSHAASHGIHRREALDFWLARAENVSLNHYSPPRAYDQGDGADDEPDSMPCCILVKPSSPRRTPDTIVRDHTAIRSGRCTRGPSCCGIRVLGCDKRRPSAAKQTTSSSITTTAARTTIPQAIWGDWEVPSLGLRV